MSGDGQISDTSKNSQSSGNLADLGRFIDLGGIKVDNAETKSTQPSTSTSDNSTSKASPPKETELPRTGQNRPNTGDPTPYNGDQESGESINRCNLRRAMERGGTMPVYSETVDEVKRIVSGATHKAVPNKLIDAPLLGKPGAMGDRAEVVGNRILAKEEQKQRAGMNHGAPIENHFFASGMTAAAVSLAEAPLAKAVLASKFLPYSPLNSVSSMTTTGRAAQWLCKGPTWFGRGAGAAVVYQLANDGLDSLLYKADHKNNPASYLGWGLGSMALGIAPSEAFRHNAVGAEIKGLIVKPLAAGGIIGGTNMFGKSLGASNEIGVHSRGFRSHVPESVAVGGIVAAPIDWKLKAGLITAVFIGSRVLDATAPWLQPCPNDIRKKTRETLIPDDQKQRTAESMNKAIDEYKKYGLDQANGGGMDDVLAQDFDSWERDKLYKDPQTDKLITATRGKAVVAIAAGESRMERGTLLPKQQRKDDDEIPRYILTPDRNKDKGQENDYLDFGGQALYLLKNGYQLLKKSQAATQEGLASGLTIADKKVDSKEIEDLQKMEPRVRQNIEKILQRNLDGSAPASYKGHDVFGALKELCHKDEFNAAAALQDIAEAAKAVLTGKPIHHQDHLGLGSKVLKNESGLYQKLQRYVAQSKDSTDPLDVLYVAKLERDLALIQLGMVIKYPAVETAKDFDKALKYLQDAKSRDPDNPDNAKLDAIASTIAGANWQAPTELGWISEQIQTNSTVFKSAWESYAKTPIQVVQLEKPKDTLTPAQTVETTQTQTQTQAQTQTESTEKVGSATTTETKVETEANKPAEAPPITEATDPYKGLSQKQTDDLERWQQLQDLQDQVVRDRNRRRQEQATQQVDTQKVDEAALQAQFQTVQQQQRAARYQQLQNQSYYNSYRQTGRLQYQGQMQYPQYQDTQGFVQQPQAQSADNSNSLAQQQMMQQQLEQLAAQQQMQQQYQWQQGQQQYMQQSNAYNPNDGQVF